MHNENAIHKANTAVYKYRRDHCEGVHMARPVFEYSEKRDQAYVDLGALRQFGMYVSDDMEKDGEVNGGYIDVTHREAHDIAINILRQLREVE